MLYVQFNGITGQLLPLEPWFSSGQACWWHLGRWQKAGPFDQPHRLLLAELHAVGELYCTHTRAPSP